MPYDIFSTADAGKPAPEKLMDSFCAGGWYLPALNLVVTLVHYVGSLFR